MSEISMGKARNEFADLINRAAYAKERIVLTRRGRKIVAIVPIEDLELIEHLEDEEDIRDANSVLEEYKKTGEAYNWEDVKKEPDRESA